MTTGTTVTVGRSTLDAVSFVPCAGGCGTEFAPHRAGKYDKRFCCDGCRARSRRERTSLPDPVRSTEPQVRAALKAYLRRAGWCRARFRLRLGRERG